MGLNSRICHHRLALAGLDHHEARAVEGQLEGLARPASNEGPHLETALDLWLKVRRPADRRLRVNSPPAGQRRSAAASSPEASAGCRGRGRCLARWWCLAVECCGRREDSATEFRIRYCHGRAPSPRRLCER